MRALGLAVLTLAVCAQAQAQSLNDYLGGWAVDAASCASRGPTVIVIGEQGRGLAFWYAGMRDRPLATAIPDEPVAKISLTLKRDNGEKTIALMASGGSLTIANPAKNGDVDFAGGTFPDGESATFVACDKPGGANKAYWDDCAGGPPGGPQFPPSAVERACTGLIEMGLRDPARLSEAYRFRSIARRKGGNAGGALGDAKAAVEFAPASAPAKENLAAMSK